MLSRIVTSRTYGLLMVAAIFASIALFVYDQLAQVPMVHGPNISVLQIVEYSIVALFVADYLIRIKISDKVSKYLFSFAGIVDFAASIPALIGILVGVNVDSSSARVLRLLSLSRVFKSFNTGSILGGVTARVLPYALMALGLKSLLLVIEAQDWWVLGTQLTFVLGVVGFSLAILMGAKLSAVNGRLFAIEDTICHLVGGMRDMNCTGETASYLKAWGANLEKFLKLPYSSRKQTANHLRQQTTNLEAQLEEAGITGPNTAGFHRDAAFLIHRATSRTPVAYDRFLRLITITYCVSIMIVIQGVAGIVSTFLSVLVLGGMYFLIEDIDDPLSHSDESFIDARIDALQFWNEERTNQSSCAAASEK